MQDDVWKTDPEWFKPWFNTEAYHILYGHRSDSEARDLVEALIQKGCLGEPGRALDAGCGSGRHARALANQGWKVDAFDLSEASIVEARQTTFPSVAYRCLDIRSLRDQSFWTGTFDLATNFFTSLGYFDKTSENEAVIEGFANVLKPGGILLLDFLNVPFVKANLVESETIEKQNISFQIHRRIQGGWIEKSIQFDWEGVAQHHVERVRTLSRSDFENLLSRHGLIIRKTWGDYTLSDWSPLAPRCIILAERKPE